MRFTNVLGAHLFAADVDTALDGATDEDRISPRVSVHLHGAVTPPDMDGHPEDTFRPATSWPPLTANMNNMHYHDDPIPDPRQGTTEIWEFVNVSPDTHPMHVHLVNMRILDRQTFDMLGYLAANPKPAAIGTPWAPEPDRFLTGTPQPPRAWETGAKDTVTCPEEGVVTRVAITFPTADELGFDPDAMFPSDGMMLQGCVWHCHLIDHEDECMMARFRLHGEDPSPAAAEDPAMPHSHH